MWQGLLILSMLNWMDLPVPGKGPVMPDLVVQLDAVVAGYDEVRNQVDGTYPGILGGMVGLHGDFYKAMLGFYPGYGLVMSLFYRWDIPQGELFVGLDRLFLPSLESEGTKADTTAPAFSRIPLVAGAGYELFPGFRLALGVGFGSYALELQSTPPKLKGIGVFGGLSFQPVPWVRLNWEAFEPSQKRNLGLEFFVPTLPGLRFMANFRYVDYTSQAWTSDHTVYGVEYRRPLQLPQAKEEKKVLERVALVGVVSDRTTGKPVAGVIVYRKGDTVGVKTDAQGRFRLILPRGKHVIAVRGAPRYLDVEQPITLSGASPRVVTRLLLEPSPAYKQYLVLVQEARKLQQGGDLAAASERYRKALKLVPGGAEATAGLKEIRALVDQQVRALKTRAVTAEKKGQYSTALKLWNQVLTLAPQDKEAKAGVRRVRAALARVNRKPARKPAARKTLSRSEIKALLQQAKQAFLQGEYARARQLALRVLRADPGNQEARNLKIKAEQYLRATGGQ